MKKLFTLSVVWVFMLSMTASFPITAEYRQTSTNRSFEISNSYAEDAEITNENVAEAFGDLLDTYVECISDESPFDLEVSFENLVLNTATGKLANYDEVDREYWGFRYSKIIEPNVNSISSYYSYVSDYFSDYFSEKVIDKIAYNYMPIEQDGALYVKVFNGPDQQNIYSNSIELIEYKDNKYKVSALSYDVVFAGYYVFDIQKLDNKYKIVDVKVINADYSSPSSYQEIELSGPIYACPSEKSKQLYSINQKVIPVFYTTEINGEIWYLVDECYYLERGYGGWIKGENDTSGIEEFTNLDVFTADVWTEFGGSGEHFTYEYNVSAPVGLIDLYTPSQVYLMEADNSWLEGSIAVWKTTNGIIENGANLFIPEKKELIDNYEIILLSMLNSYYETNVNTLNGIIRDAEYYQVGADIAEFFTNDFVENWRKYDEQMTIEQLEEMYLFDEKIKTNINVADWASFIVENAVDITEAYDRMKAFSRISQLNDDVISVITKMKENCPKENKSLYQALVNVENQMTQNFSDEELFNQFITHSVSEITVNVIFDKVMESGWEALLKANPLTQGMQLGQEVGKLVSNILFNTDEIADAYFSMQQVYDVENLFGFVRDTAYYYVDNRNIADAKLIVTSIRLFKNLVSLDVVFAKNFAEQATNNGLWNLFNNKSSEILAQIDHYSETINNSYKTLEDKVKNRLKEIDYEMYDYVYLNNFTYRVLYDGTAEITGYTGNKTNITIPSTIDGYVVASIGNLAFYNYSSLISIEIPESVTSIGDKAFAECLNLVLVNIPDNVSSIGAGAFYSCSS
ncbi:MAG: leucine-rich repeat domain-containing protein [Oscillospiraceae bacterium]|jgi:hypothetical protein|nr:leucine-rich repeat domain-containing protein [Oscillospiraceae bacterium]